MLTTIERIDLGLDDLEHFPELMQTVTRQDVQRVAPQYLKPNHGVLVILADRDQVGLTGSSLP
jgi:predicted Zn-dependent peptidase